MLNASIGKFYFEALEEIMDELEQRILDLNDIEFPTTTTDERSVALKKLYRDLDNLENVKSFLLG